MKKIFLIAIGLVLAATVAYTLVPAICHGNAKDINNNNLGAGWTISVQGYTCVTDINGYFSIGGGILPQNMYYLRATKPGQLRLTSAVPYNLVAGGNSNLGNVVFQLGITPGE